MSNEEIPHVIDFLKQKQKREIAAVESSPLGLSEEEIYTFLYVLDVLRARSAMQNGEITFTPDSVTVSIFHPLGDDKEIGEFASTNVFAERMGALDFEWETQKEFDLLVRDFKKLLEEVCL